MDYPDLQDPDAQYPELQDPDVKPDWTNIGGKVPQGKPEDNWGKAWDRIGANVQAGYTGVMQLGSSIAKIADKIGVAPEGTAQSAQDTYNEAEKIYQKGAYPETAVSKFAGSMLVPGASKPITLGAKLLGSTALGTAGKYLGASLGGAASGAAVGGLLNTLGNSPEDVWNEDAVLGGALLGAPLGAAGQLLSSYGKNVAGYQKAQEELEGLGYKGPVLARDYGDEVVANAKSTWMDNIVTTHIRDEQLQAINPAVKQLLTAASEQQGSHRVGQIIRGTHNRLEKESSDMWTNLFNSVKEQGISKIDTSNTKAAASDFLNNYGENLSKADKKILSTLSMAKQVDFGVLNKVKGKDIWSMSEKFAKKDGSAYEDMAAGLKDLYWNITDDIGNTLKNKPELEQSWNAAKEFTRGVKETFNVKANRKLMNAIEDVNENKGQLKTFINSVFDPVSSTPTKYYNKVLGPAYQESVEKLAFRKIFNDSFNTEAKGLNLGKFFGDIKEANNSKLLNNDTVKALGGLETFFNKIQSTQVASKPTNTVDQVRLGLPVIQVGSVGAGYMAGGVPGGLAAGAAILGGPKLLGWLSKNSPVKNLLIGLSKVYGKNPSITEYLADKVGKKLSQAGVTLKGDTADIHSEE